MTARTTTANGEACALVLELLVAQLEAHPLARAYVMRDRQAFQLHAAAKAALRGERLQMRRCVNSACEWRGAFSVHQKFACAKCGRTDQVLEGRPLP